MMNTDRIDAGLNSSNRIPQVTFGEGYSMFHLCQESSAMLNELTRRNLACYDQKRRSEMNRSRFLFHRVPRALSRQPLPGTIKLTMEIQSGDFASLLGQREAWSSNDSVAEIMRKTNCMIQFADQRSARSVGHVNNQVVITGAFPNIDEAYRRLRNLAPITIAISLKNVRKDLPNKTVSVSLTKWCAEGGELSQYSKIQFNVVQPQQWLAQHQQHKGPFLVIRGSYSDSKAILEVSEKIQRLLFNSNAKEDFCSRLEISTLYRRWVVGSPDGVLMRTISTYSSCVIHFPYRDGGQSASSSYLLSGSAKAVVTAIKMFYEVNPVRMEFEVENAHLACPILKHQEKKREYDSYDLENNIVVTFRKSHFEGEFRLEDEELRHTVCLMTSEENINNMYNLRRKLLKNFVWESEKAPLKRRTNRPRFIEYLHVLITEASEKKAQYTKSVGNHQYNNNSRHDWI